MEWEQKLEIFLSTKPKKKKEKKLIILRYRLSASTIMTIRKCGSPYIPLIKCLCLSHPSSLLKERKRETIEGCGGHIHKQTDRQREGGGGMEGEEETAERMRE